MLMDKLGEWEEKRNTNHSTATRNFNRYLDKKEDDQILNNIKDNIKLLLFNNRDIVDTTKAREDINKGQNNNNNTNEQLMEFDNEFNNEFNNDFYDEDEEDEDEDEDDEDEDDEDKDKDED